MRAAWREQYGGPHVVEVREIERPVPAGNQVLVRVHAASVNRADLDGITPRWMFVRLFAGLRRPREQRVGIDVAGVVEAVGESAAVFKIGDRVFADLIRYGSGAFAEYVCAREKAFALVPDDMSFEVAATLPHSAILALQGLRLGNGRIVGKGDRLLVVGASGNVGPFAVQIAKSRGAHVTGVASGDKLDLVRSLGADEVIDYETTDYTRPAQPYDWIVDVDAHHPLRRWRRALTPRGVYLSMGGSGGWLLSMAFWQPALKLATGRTMGLMLHWRPFAPDDVEALKRLVASGVVKPVIDGRYPLEQVVEALRHVDEGRARGKVLVLP
ncbi:MAG TPA: NAD(P)-dependent alcohol dehydrogenase [Candidatus Limnocylindria bacterium]|nr:NAD(P)-dependent alcohol dehydrogenase [Candidatus Limnocylindria bacterium]